MFVFQPPIRLPPCRCKFIFFVPHVIASCDRRCIFTLGGKDIRDSIEMLSKNLFPLQLSLGKRMFQSACPPRGYCILRPKQASRRPVPLSCIWTSPVRYSSSGKKNGPVFLVFVKPVLHVINPTGSRSEVGVTFFTTVGVIRVLKIFQVFFLKKNV